MKADVQEATYNSKCSVMQTCICVQNNKDALTCHKARHVEQMHTEANAVCKAKEWHDCAKLNDH